MWFEPFEYTWLFFKFLKYKERSINFPNTIFAFLTFMHQLDNYLGKAFDLNSPLFL